MRYWFYIIMLVSFVISGCGGASPVTPTVRAATPTLRAATPTPIPTPAQAAGEALGTWVDDVYSVDVSIFERGNKLYINDGFEDIELTSTDGQTFARVDGGNEYFKIDANGDLEFWDAAGYLYTAKKK